MKDFEQYKQYRFAFYFICFQVFAFPLGCNTLNSEPDEQVVGAWRDWAELTVADLHQASRR